MHSCMDSMLGASTSYCNAGSTCSYRHATAERSTISCEPCGQWSSTPHQCTRGQQLLAIGAFCESSLRTVSKVPAVLAAKLVWLKHAMCWQSFARNLMDQAAAWVAPGFGSLAYLRRLLKKGRISSCMRCCLAGILKGAATHLFCPTQKGFCS